MADTDRVIPLTPPGPNWSQREYVKALTMGIGFAAHRVGQLGQVFHYGFPGDIGCTSVIVNSNGPLRYVDHAFGPRPVDWIERCRLALVVAAQRGEV